MGAGSGGASAAVSWTEKTVGGRIQGAVLYASERRRKERGLGSGDKACCVLILLVEEKQPLSW